MQKKKDPLEKLILLNGFMGEKKMTLYGTKYRGCSYAKVYEVFDIEGNIIKHAYSARESRYIINKDLAERAKKRG